MSVDLLRGVSKARLKAGIPEKKKSRGLEVDVTVVAKQIKILSKSGLSKSDGSDKIGAWISSDKSKGQNDCTAEPLKPCQFSNAPAWLSFSMN